MFLGFAGTCFDIDDRKRAELELARALERERKLRIAQDRIICEVCKNFPAL